MPSVQPALGTPPQTASNTVLFEMMMFYKRKMEIAEETATQDRKRLKKAMHIAYEARERLQQEQRNNLTLNNENGVLRAQMQTAARVVMRKHNAGMGIVACMNVLVECIDTVEDTSQEYNNMLGIEYISMHKRAAVGRAAGFLEDFIDDEVDLETNEVIDLTEEDTEEEDVGEWV